MGASPFPIKPTPAIVYIFSRLYSSTFPGFGFPEDASPTPEIKYVLSLLAPSLPLRFEPAYPSAQNVCLRAGRKSKISRKPANWQTFTSNFHQFQRTTRYRSVGQ